MYVQCIYWHVRASTLVRLNFLSILHEKTYFFYFTHPLLQNTHISLSILHIYSIKYSFFYYFFIIFFTSLSLIAYLSLSQRTTAITKQPTSTIINPSSQTSSTHPTISTQMKPKYPKPYSTQKKPKYPKSHSTQTKAK